MEVEVANDGPWQDLVLSVRCGETRRQAPLGADTRIVFPQEATEAVQMQVDVFEKVGTKHITVDPSCTEVYDVSIRGQGFATVPLRVRPQAEAGGLRNRFADAMATDEYIDQHDLQQFTNQVSHSMRGSDVRGSDSESVGTGNTGTSTTEDRISKVRQDAAKYVEKFDLRQVLQDMFQRVIKERPEDPFKFMQEFLNSGLGGAGLDPASQARFAAVASVEADAAEEEARLRQLAEASAQLELLRLENVALQQKVEESNGIATRIHETSSDEVARLRAEVDALRRREATAGGGAGGVARGLEPAGPGAEQVSRERAVLEERHRDALGRCAELERRCREAEAASGEAQRRVQDLVKLAGSPAASVVASQETPTPRAADQLRPTSADIAGLTERMEVERRAAAQALLERSQLERRCYEAEGQNEVLQKRHDQQQTAMRLQQESVESLQRRVQELEAGPPKAGGAAVPARQELDRSYEQQIERQQTKIEVLQRRLQAWEASGGAGADCAGGPNPEARGDAAAGGTKEAAGAAAPAMPTVPGPLLRPVAGTMTTALPATTGSLVGLGSSTGASEMNTHMFSQLLASTYAPPVAPTTYIEAREDAEIDLPAPDPSLLVEVVDCKDVMSNGTFAWVGVCNLRPLYRLLGPEPRYLYYAENDIASSWRIVDKMGSEEFVERFRKPIDAKLPVQCEKGDFSACVVEALLTSEVVQRISMVSSHEEKMAIRGKFSEAFGQIFVSLEGVGRGLISKTSPVVAVAHALESQQRAIQLLHSQLSAEAHRREAAEQHAQAMEHAFETLQLRIQAQLPGPPSVAGLQELQASIAHGQSSRGLATLPEEHEVLERGFVFEKDGKVDWAPDLGPGCGPVPHPPLQPKDRKPMPPPTFRRGPRGLRNTPGQTTPVVPSGSPPAAMSLVTPQMGTPDPAPPPPELIAARAAAIAAEQ